MSGELDKVVQNLPDVWYDWYARLIPGCFGLGLYLYFSSSIQTTPTTVQVVLFLLGGYGLGHVLQPLTSLPLSKWKHATATNRRSRKPKKTPQ